MAFEGMDVDEVGRLHQQMIQLAQQLENVINAMPGVLGSLGEAWKGPDSAQFQGQWPTHHAQLLAAHAGMTEMATVTNSNLQQQIQTSAHL